MCLMESSRRFCAAVQDSDENGQALQKVGSKHWEMVGVMVGLVHSV
jgi:hypothetical protein